MPPSRRYKPPEMSRSAEILDKESADSLKTSSSGNRTRTSLDNRSQSELDVWQGAQRSDVASAAHGAVISSISQPSTRRGSLGQVSGSSLNTEVSDQLQEDRWSWKGSFESALAMESVKNQNKQKSITGRVHLVI